MTEAIKATTFMNLIFIIFLMLSGTVGGLFGEVIYYLAFMIPIALGIYVASGLKIKREEALKTCQSLYHSSTKKSHSRNLSAGSGQ